MSERDLSVKAITRLTGLNEHTLRAWERRYGAVRPQRLENGRRAYTDEDVERLRKMVRLVEHGHAIGAISTLADAELGALLARQERRDESMARPPELSAAVEATLAALARYDLAEAHRELDRARFRLGAKAFVLELVSPLMAEMGRRVLAETLTLGQGHALTGLLKTELARDLPAPRGGVGSTTVAIATMEGDLHELAILIGAVLCADRGVAACYLGPSLPPGALAEAATALGVKAVLLGMAPLPPGTAPWGPLRYLEKLDEGLPAACELWVGGGAVVEAGLGAEVGSHWASRRSVRLISSLPDLDAILAELS